MSNEDEYLQRTIIEHEIKLQKLWYKFYVYNSMIENVFENMLSIDLDHAKKEIFRTKIEYSNLIKVDATGSSFTNSVRLALNKTSRIENLYNSFLQNAILLKEMEDLN